MNNDNQYFGGLNGDPNMNGMDPNNMNNGMNNMNMGMVQNNMNMGVDQNNMDMGMNQMPPQQPMMNQGMNQMPPQQPMGYNPNMNQMPPQQPMPQQGFNGPAYQPPVGGQKNNKTILIIVGVVVAVVVLLIIIVGVAGKKNGSSGKGGAGGSSIVNKAKYKKTLECSIHHDIIGVNYDETWNFFINDGETAIEYIKIYNIDKFHSGDYDTDDKKDAFAKGLIDEATEACKDNSCKSTYDYKKGKTLKLTVSYSADQATSVIGEGLKEKSADEIYDKLKTNFTNGGIDGISSYTCK